MQRRTIRSFSVLLIFASLVLLACDIGLGSISKPTIVIASPASGSQFREGEDIAVQSTSTDSDGIVRVELLVDGTVVRTDPAPSPQISYALVQTWKATAGQHTLSVRAYNKSNAASDPAAIVVSVQGTGGAAPTSIALQTTQPTGAAPTAVPPTAAPGTCTNNAAFVADVTVPDGTLLAPGQTFNKIWRIRNSGTCAWEAGYQFVFAAGEAMTTSTTNPVPNTAPGATADLLVAMTAPGGAGAHAGQWRMRAPSGTLFGGAVTVNIKVLAKTATPTTAPSCSGAPVIASFTASATAITPGSSTTLQWGAVTNAESVEIDNGVGGIATPGSANVSPGSTTTYTMTARCGSNTTTRQLTITVNPTVPPAPSLTSPAEGAVLRVAPRVATFSWGAVTFTGGVTYTIEIQINTGTWQQHALQTGLTTTNFTMPAFPGDNPGRWRVWATSATAGEGTKTNWRTFSFDTSASQYSANWINNDSESEIARIFISNSGQTLTVRPFGKCAPTECDWGAKDQLFTGEPIVITGFPDKGSGHQLSMTLGNAAGTTLNVNYTYPGGSSNLTFHK